jgi:hypothetical protein
MSVIVPTKAEILACELSARTTQQNNLTSLKIQHDTTLRGIKSSFISQKNASVASLSRTEQEAITQETNNYAASKLIIENNTKAVIAACKLPRVS